MERLRSTEAQDVTVGSFKFIRRINGGAFGDIYLAMNVINGEKAAIKVESTHILFPQLEYEQRVYKALGPFVGLPRIKHFCKEPTYHAMVLELLGPSLEQLFQSCGRCFTLKTILMLADQMLELVEYIHNRGFVHRDIKPENFLIGRGGSSKQVFLIDFGLSKKFWDPTTDVHIPYREECGLTGTARYASACSQEGMEQSRRDDLMSVGYILIYFLRGKLPWQGVKVSTRELKYQIMQDLKQSISNEKLCLGLPSAFSTYLNYCRGLGFYNKPDYEYLRKMFKQLGQAMYFCNDKIFDWELLKMIKPSQTNHGLDKRVFPPEAASDNGSSGFPIVRNPKCGRWD